MAKKKKEHILLAVFTILIIVLLAFTLSNLSNPNPQDSTSTQSFVGSKNSDVYHYPSCSYVSRIKSENKIWFSSSQDARNHGYRPCKVCSPP